VYVGIGGKMARLTREETKLREMASEDVIEAILGTERMRVMIKKDIDAYLNLARVFYESGMTARELRVLENEIKNLVG